MGSLRAEIRSRFALYVLLALLALLAAVLYTAPDRSAPDLEAARQAARRVAARNSASSPYLLCRAENDFAPWVSARGHPPKGYLVDLCRALSRELGVEMRLVCTAWPSALADTISGRADLLVGVYDIPSRRSVLDFSTHLCTVRSRIFVARDVLHLSTPEELQDGPLVAVQRDDASTIYLRSNYPRVRLREYADLPSAVRALALGEASAYVGDFEAGMNAARLAGYGSKVKAVGPDLFTAPYCVAVRRGDRELLSAIDQGLQSLRAKGELSRLEGRWFGEGFFGSGESLRSLLRWLVGLFGVAALLALWNWSLHGALRRRSSALLATQSRLAAAERVGRLGTWHWDLVEDHMIWSEGSYQLHGRSDELPPYTLDEYVARVHPEDAAAFRAACEALQAGGPPSSLDYRVTLDSGASRVFSITAQGVRGSSGAVTALLGVTTDVTEARRLEEQLSQARKMEAIGQLAGGVAHDFNNLLTAILGYSELGLAQVGAGDRLRRPLEEIRRASERAATLTRQLLTFSRRQVLEPRVVQFSAEVLGVEEMLRRLLGETIELATSLPRDAGYVRADPSQLEQVVVNLSVNARDAMPDGGRLTLETGNTHLDADPAAGQGSGPYVFLRVSDTGVGMDPETQSHIFEPFFSTKERGRGTGLGLATVYGIVQQSGGRLDVVSRVGEGTTFTVYLPRVPGPEEEPRDEGRPPLGKGTESVLVVEDEPMVRALAVSALVAQGYRVRETANGEEALALARAEVQDVHLLVSDVIMPGLSGPQVAERLQAINPCLRVLFISGYTEEALPMAQSRTPGRALLAKPFGPEALCRAARQLLDEPLSSPEQESLVRLTEPLPAGRDSAGLGGSSLPTAGGLGQ